jgi:tetratricopeptide (TPR) repeat protein
LNILVYMSFHFHLLADRKARNYRTKIEILDKAAQFYPLNEQVYRELGRTYFDLALDDLSDPEQRDFGLEKSAENFIHAVRLNPGEYINHLYLAQTLLYENYFFAEQTEYFQEFLKAARLTNHDENVYYEVGKAMLLRWDELSDEDRLYGQELIKNSSNLRSRERVLDLLQTWALSGVDYEAIREILPEDASVFRLYADFLAEKSMSLEERQRALVVVESKEFEAAKKLYREGMENYRRYRLKEAQNKFKSSLRLLDRIYLYQNLSGRTDIDTEEWIDLRKGLYSNLLRSSVDLDSPVSEVREYLRLFLEVEEDELRIDEVEEFLTEKNFISEEEIPPTDDTDRLYCRLLLDYIKHRYRRIKILGERLKDRFVLPESNHRKYVDIYKIIADSYQDLDSLYDAAEFYEKILQIDPKNLKSLLSSLKNYERLNNEKQINRIQSKIDEAITPPVFSYEAKLLEKGNPFSFDLTLLDQSITLEIVFQYQNSTDAPLVQLLYNGQVVYEDYIEGPLVRLDLDSRAGNNHLQIACLNRDIRLDRIQYVIQ